MTDTKVPTLGTGRRAPRVMKLERPAPLKRSISLDPATIPYKQQETENIPNHDQTSTVKTTAENNTFLGVRAPRRTNLKKPLPRSKSTTEEHVMSENQSINQSNEGNLSNPMTPNTAKKTADSLVDDVLSHLILEEKSRVNAAKPRFRSQVSVDSGVGDCNNSSFISSLCIGRKDSLNEVLLDEGFNEYPVDILTIEEELSSLADSNMETESLSESNVIEPYRSQNVTESHKPYQYRRKCKVEREPISPTTILPSGSHDMNDILTANGRRRMFQLYRNSCTEVKNHDISQKVIKYTANELLEIGTSPLSHKPAETWAYLVHILPHICFPRVDKYFDAGLYSIRREYVVECSNVKGSSYHHPAIKFPVKQFDSQSTEEVQGHIGNHSKVIEEYKYQEQTETLSLRPMYLGQESTGNQSQGQGHTVYQAHMRHEEQVTIPLHTAKMEAKMEEKFHKPPAETGKRGVLRESARTLDLDSKCDVSVRWESGAIKLFAAARQDLQNARNLNSSIWLPTKVDGSMPGRDGTEVKQVKPRYFEEDYYFNPDLPEKCPW